MIGKVCRCSKGRLGIITGYKELPWGGSYTGVGLDGKGLWASRNPEVVAESIYQYAYMLEEQQRLELKEGLAEYEREMDAAVPEIVRDVQNRAALADEARQIRLD